MFNDFFIDTKNHNGRLSQWQCIIVNISSVETLWSAGKGKNPNFKMKCDKKYGKCDFDW